MDNLNLDNGNSISIEELIGQIPEGLNEIQTIRYIYIKLGKFFNYNIEFLFSDKKTQEHVYNKKIDLKKIDENSKICIHIAKYLSQAINHFVKNVNATTMIRSARTEDEGDDFEHVATKVCTSNGEKYILDLTLDLYRIQNNLCTKEFGYSSYIDDDYDIISLRELRQIDNEIGYTWNELYMDEYVEQMKKEMRDINLVKEYVINNNCEEIDEQTILEYKVDFILGNMDIKNNGPIEAKQYVVYAMSEILKDEEKGRVKQFNLYNKKEKPKMTVGLRVIVNDRRIYYIREENENFRKIEFKELAELINNDWYIKSQTINNETGRIMNGEEQR